MERLEFKDFSAFLDRFNFCDSLLDTISLRYHRDDDHDHLELVLISRERVAQETWEWVRVLLQVEGVCEFRIFQPRQTTLQVVSNGIHLLPVGEKVAIEFSGVIDEPETASSLRMSDAYAIGDAIWFDTSPDTSQSPRS